MKGKLRKNGDKPAEAPAAASPAVKATPFAPPSSGAIPASLFDDRKQMRNLKDRCGDNFQKMGGDRLTPKCLIGFLGRDAH